MTIKLSASVILYMGFSDSVLLPQIGESAFQSLWKQREGRVIHSYLPEKKLCPLILEYIIVASHLCKNFAFIIITVPSKKIEMPITALSCFRCFDWLRNEIKQQKGVLYTVKSKQVNNHAKYFEHPKTDTIHGYNKTSL